MGRIPIVVAIPTRYHTNMIKDLIPSMQDADKIMILDNGLLEEDLLSLKKYKKIHILYAKGKTIYEMWNLARRLFPNTHLAILNDDIYFLPQTLSFMSEVLRTCPNIAAVCPDYNTRAEQGFHPTAIVNTTSTYGNGGLAGFAFMLNTFLPIPMIDETFQWWYGDDDLVYQIQKAGYKVAKVIGLPLEHVQGMSSRHDPTIPGKRIQDCAYFNQKYGENRQV